MGRGGGGKFIKIIPLKIHPNEMYETSNLLLQITISPIILVLFFKNHVKMVLSRSGAQFVQNIKPI